MEKGEQIARISDVIIDCCPNDMKLIDCAKIVVKAAVNAGIPKTDIELAVKQLYD